MTQVIKVIPGEEWLNTRFVTDYVKSNFLEQIYVTLDQVYLNADLSSSLFVHRGVTLPDDASLFEHVVWFSPKHDTNSAKSIPLFDKATRRDYLKFIIEEGRRYNLNLEDCAAALFVSVGNCAHKLAIEIEKLFWITLKDGSFTNDDFKSAVCFSAKETPKKIIEAICEGRINKALAWYDHLQKEENETGWILSYLEKFFDQCIKIGGTKLDQGELNQILDKVEVPRYRYESEHKLALARYHLSVLQKAYAIFNQLYAYHKAGRLHSHHYISLELMRIFEEPITCP